MPVSLSPDRGAVSGWATAQADQPRTVVSYERARTRAMTILAAIRHGLDPAAWRGAAPEEDALGDSR